MKNIKTIVTFMLPLLMLAACNNTIEKKDTCTIHGTIKGLTNGKVIIDCPFASDTILVENEKFVYEKKFKEPTSLLLRIVKKEEDPSLEIGTLDFESLIRSLSPHLKNGVNFFGENCDITLVAHKDSLRLAHISAGEFQKEYLKYCLGMKLLEEKYNYDELFEEFCNPNTSKERKEEISMSNKACQVETSEYRINFPKNNPTLEYSAYLLEQIIHGDNAKDIEKKLAFLDKSLGNSPFVIRMRKAIDKMNETEVDFGSFLKKAGNVKYKLDEGFNGSWVKNVIYLSIINEKNICALTKNNSVKIISPEGKIVNEFKIDITGKPSVIAVSKSNNIYILANQVKTIQKKYRGRSTNREIATGVLCSVFDIDGKKMSEFKLASNVTASGARVVANKLIVSDCKNKLVGIYDSKMGKLISKIENMRSCCGLLDFSVRDNEEILVANLGAFRVQSYDLNGNTKIAFGRRGQELNDFHGCCNPVSVAYLSSGAIVTVEKEPTRVKIYGKQGAKQIDGIEELVKGCSYIPMIVDSKDNLYLASKEKGIIRCISAN